MPGIATHFKILELSIDRLKSSSDPDLQNKGLLMETHSTYAYLGAVGPMLADFIPAVPLPDPDYPWGYSNEYAARLEFLLIVLLSWFG